MFEGDLEAAVLEQREESREKSSRKRRVERRAVKRKERGFERRIEGLEGRADSVMKWAGFERRRG